ncbi:MAG: helix-turn-helix domain-containing protein [Myxococcales bacterium]|nr:helix-turn-helix domain-containing protein [Myxococcales bacterium]MDD9968580.1 helix-turn-helix domain-containing protein [Myxococcales bacterium]
MSTRTIRLDGERCARLRRQRGWSRERLASLTSGASVLSVGTIARAERGRAVYPSSAAALAAALGVPLEELTALPPLQAGPMAGPSTLHARSASVEVAPFVCRTRRRGCAEVADRLSEELIYQLTGDWFSVTTVATTAPADSTRAPGASGAHYRVGGTVDELDRVVRTTASLVEVRGAQRLWSLQRELPDAGAPVVGVAREMAGAIRRHVQACEMQRAMQAQHAADAWNLAMRGLWHYQLRTPTGSRQARSLFQRAGELDPTFALARYWLVLTLQHDLLNQWTSDGRETLGHLREGTEQLQRIAPDHHLASLAAARCSIACGARDEALAWVRQALERQPDSVSARSLYGQLLSMDGRPELGLEQLELASQRGSQDPDLSGLLIGRGLSHFAAGQYEQAVQWSRKAIRERPQVAFFYGALAATLAHAGDRVGARQALREMVRRQACLSSRALQPVVASSAPAIAQRYVDGLRLAGMRDR